MRNIGMYLDLILDRRFLAFLVGISVFLSGIIFGIAVNSSMHLITVNSSMIYLSTAFISLPMYLLASFGIIIATMPFVVEFMICFEYYKQNKHTNSDITNQLLLIWFMFCLLTIIVTFCLVEATVLAELFGVIH